MSAKPSQEPKRDNKAAKTDSKNESSAEKRLPFEPAQTRKKVAKKAASASVVKSAETSEKAAAKQAAAIPEVISRRMARRMAFFCGIPTSLGMLTLLVSYIIVSQHWYKLPNAAVLLVNLGFFGLGVLGLSYGALSASWDEDRLGSWFGWGEFQTNFSRLTQSWRSTQKKPESD